jgi:hypothetical protein
MQDDDDAGSGVCRGAVAHHRGHTGSFDAIGLDELLRAYEQERGSAGSRSMKRSPMRLIRKTCESDPPFSGTLLEHRIERDHLAPRYHLQSASLLDHAYRDAPPEAAAVALTEWPSTLRSRSQVRMTLWVSNGASELDFVRA